MPRMMRRRGWEIPESEVTPEHVYVNRRAFLKALGFGALGLAGAAACGRPAAGATPTPAVSPTPLGPTPTPAPLNATFTLDRPLTDEKIATTFNNFYEFSLGKDQVWGLVSRFQTRPWEVEVAGLVARPRVYDLDDLKKLMAFEERRYRFRCVETWAMANPWTGFPLKALIDLVEPQSTAKYVGLTTFLRPDEAPGQYDRSFPWPYTEGLSMAEATHELTFVATGMYGKDLPKQNGGPIRLVVPWKYGYKSIKSIVRIEFTDVQPATFWNTMSPDEYPFQSNVDPAVPHPRWSQARETMLGTGEKRDTLPYNGYGEYVAQLYK